MLYCSKLLNVYHDQIWNLYSIEFTISGYHILQGDLVIYPSVYVMGSLTHPAVMPHSPGRASLLTLPCCLTHPAVPPHSRGSAASFTRQCRLTHPSVLPNSLGRAASFTRPCCLTHPAVPPHSPDRGAAFTRRYRLTTMTYHYTEVNSYMSQLLPI